jgi:pimeloyl-ACP methyl ester carboxylesterase
MLTLIAHLLAAALPDPAPGPSPSQSSSVAIAGSELDGDWDGGMTVPAGLTIPFSLHVAGNGGAFAAPDQNVRGLVIAVTRNQDRVVIQVPAAKAVFEGALSAGGHVMDGTWSQGAERFPAHFTRRAVGATPVERPRPQTPRGPFPYRVEDVAFPGGGPGVRLAGTLTSPAGPGLFPAVLLIGGNGPQNRDETYAGHRPFLVLADRLTRAGVAVLRYDKRGVGASTGHYATANGADFTRDAAAALAWLRRQSGVAPTRVGVLGLSEGSLIAPLVAAQDRGTAFVVLLSTPGVRGDRLMVEQARLDALRDGMKPAAVAGEVALRRRLLTALEQTADMTLAAGRMTVIATAAGRTPDEAAALVREMTSPEYRVFLSDDPASVLRRVRVPVLVIAGARDQQVPPALNLPPIRAALAANSQARVVELDGLNHLLQPAQTGAPSEYGVIDTTMDARVLDLVTDWIARTAAKPPRRSQDASFLTQLCRLDRVHFAIEVRPCVARRMKSRFRSGLRGECERLSRIGLPRTIICGRWGCRSTWRL